MNYKEINSAILGDRDIDENIVVKNESFYRYLFNNKVAYYYAKYLSKKTNAKEQWIITCGEELNEKYYRTLKKLKEICDTNKIDFLLYKTHKYIPEVVDGDIDIFVKKEDFHKFLLVFMEEGFESIEDEPEKGKCIKKGYLVIEPHVSISWRGGSYISEQFIWENYKDVVLRGDFLIKSASLGVELISLIGKVYFEPAYLDLYSIKQIRSISSRINLEDISKHMNFYEPFKCLVLLIEKDCYFINKKLPFFLGNIYFFKTWSRHSLRINNLKIYFLHCLFFLYWKYRYLFFSMLPFTHDWHEGDK